MNIVTTPQADVAFRANLLAWKAAHPEDTVLAKLNASKSVITDGSLPTDNIPLVKPEASSGASLGGADRAMLTITVYSSTGTTGDVRDIAYRLKDLLPHLTGNGIGSITDVRGPTKGSDVSSRRVFVLTCTTTALGVAE